MLTNIKAFSISLKITLSISIFKDLLIGAFIKPIDKVDDRLINHVIREVAQSLLFLHLIKRIIR